MRTLIGIDVSTTGVKALLIDETGSVRASETTAVALSAPHPLWSEQAPEDWWRATVESVSRLVARPGVEPSSVAAIGLTGQMHGLVLLDGQGRVLRPAILWNDQRTSAECEAIRAAVGRERLIVITGNDALAGFTAPKLLWVRAHEPDVYARARAMLLPKDYVRFRLTGGMAIDKADASGTLLFDLARREWSKELADALGIPIDWLAPTYEGPSITGTISATAAAQTGLREGTPVVAGGGDQAAGAVGVGAVDPGLVSAVLGTSGVVFTSTDAPLVDPEGRLHAFCHAVPGRWHLMGVMLSAAGSLQWYRDALAPAIDFTSLLHEAEDVAAGAEGLLFLPYLSGERTPHPDPFACGAFVGLTRRHERRHLTRAVLEGVAFGLRDCYELVVAGPKVRRSEGRLVRRSERPKVPPPLSAGMRASYGEARRSPKDDGGRRTEGPEVLDPADAARGDADRPPGLLVSAASQRVRVSGGGARNALWRQILASVLEVPVERVNSTEGAAFGAALLAGVGAGLWPDVASACRSTIVVTGCDEPVADWRHRYAEMREIYRELYPALAPVFRKLGNQVQ